MNDQISDLKKLVQENGLTEFRAPDSCLLTIATAHPFSNPIGSRFKAAVFQSKIVAKWKHIDDQFPRLAVARALKIKSADSLSDLTNKNENTLDDATWHRISILLGVDREWLVVGVASSGADGIPAWIDPYYRIVKIVRDWSEYRKALGTKLPDALAGHEIFLRIFRCIKKSSEGHSESYYDKDASVSLTRRDWAKLKIWLQFRYGLDQVEAPYVEVVERLYKEASRALRPSVRAIASRKRNARG